MKSYIINDLKEIGFSKIITLLNYETNVSKYLKSIKISLNKNEKILIDTILCTGMNKYRFIETNLNKDRSINIENCEYISVSDNIIKIANEILKKEQNSLENSVLTKSQIRKIIENKTK